MRYPLALRRAPLTAVMAAIVVACSGSPTSSSASCISTSGGSATCRGTETAPNAVVTRVVASPRDVNLEVGVSDTVDAVAYDQFGNQMSGVSVSWRSMDPAVAEARSRGQVRGRGLGNTRVTATVDGVTDTVSVRVNAPTVARIEVSPATTSLELGGTVQLSAQVRAVDLSLLFDRVVTWRSEDSEIATVSPSGLVVGQSPGSVRVLAEWEGVTGAADLVVQPPDTSAPERPASVTASVQEASSGAFSVDLDWPPVDRAADYHVTGGSETTDWSFDERTPSTSMSVSIPWESGGTYWVCVAASNDQSISGLRRCANFAGPAAAVDRVVVTPSAMELTVGARRTASVVVLDQLGATVSGARVEWTSMDSGIAKVTPQGRVSAESAGQTRVVASFGASSDTIDVSVVAAQSPVASVSVSPGTGQLQVGGTLQLSAITRASDGSVLTGRGVSWTSVHTGVVTVSASGLVTANGEGSVDVVAASEGVQGTARVTVVASQAPVHSVQVSPSVGQLDAGGTLQLSAITRASDGSVLTGRGVSWTSENTEIVNVSASGLVTANGEGSVDVVAASEGVQGAARITVVASPAPVDSVEVTPGVGQLEPGGTLQLSAITRAADGSVLTGRGVSWTSENTEIVNVSASGLVTANGEGSVDVVATSEGVQGTAQITVVASPALVDSVEVTPDVGQLEPGGTLQLSAITRAADGSVLTGRGVSWTSEDLGIVNVSASGLVTAVGAGTVDVFATSEGVQGTAEITVNATQSPPPEMPEDIAVQVGSVDASEFDVQVDWSDVAGASQYQLSGGLNSGAWSFSTETDASAATVAVQWQNGASYWVCAAAVNESGVSGEPRCTGFEAPVAPGGGGPGPVTQVSITPGSVSLSVGQSQMLSAVPRDADGQVVSGVTVDWESSNDGVATVSPSGNVIGVAQGTASIVGSIDGVSDAVTVTVLDNTPPPPSGPSWYTQNWSYGSTSSMLSDPVVDDRTSSSRGGYVSLADTLSNTPWGGSSALRSFFGGGGPEQVGVDLRLPDAGSDLPRELWIEMWVRFDDNWRTGAAGVGDHKTLFLTESGNPSGSNRWEIKFGLFVEDIRGNISSGGVHSEMGCIAPVGPGYGPCPNGKPDLEALLWDGEWHRIRWHVRMGSNANAQDGIHEAWLDGQKFLESTGIRTGSNSGAYFDRLALGRNGDPVQASSIHWGEVAVHISNPGW